MTKSVVMTSTKWLLIIFATFGSQVQAQAPSGSAGWFVSLIDRGDMQMALMLDNYIVGASILQNKFAEAGGQPLICPDDKYFAEEERISSVKINDTSEQAEAERVQLMILRAHGVLKEYLKTHSDRAADPGSRVVIDAFIWAYPCN
jgi:hypothetical protein